MLQSYFLSHFRPCTDSSGTDKVGIFQIIEFRLSMSITLFKTHLKCTQEKDKENGDEYKLLVVAAAARADQINLGHKSSQHWEPIFTTSPATNRNLGKWPLLKVGFRVVDNDKEFQPRFLTIPSFLFGWFPINHSRDAVKSFGPLFEVSVHKFIIPNHSRITGEAGSI